MAVSLILMLIISFDIATLDIMFLINNIENDRTSPRLLAYTVFFGDMLYNFVVQHRVTDEKITTHIKESTKHYLKT